MGKKVKIILFVSLILSISIGLCFFIKYIGLDDLNNIKKLLNDSIYGGIIYIILLALQVVFVPINSLILIIPAIMTFGAFKAFILSFVALLIGSILSYYIGKFFGSNVLKFFAGKQIAEKWQNSLSKNGKFMLPILLIIPIFPDELICMLAGIAKLNFWYFLTVSIFTRFVDLSCICFIGAVLPMYGWWLVLWAILIIISTIIAIWISRNQEKLQNKIISFINIKLKRRNK